jgi:hypothetical protein
MSLTRNPIFCRAVEGKRVASSRLAVPTDEFGRRSVQVEDFRLDARNRADEGGEGVRVEAAAASIHSYRDVV